MSEMSPAPVGVGVLDWAQTPQAVRTLVLALQQQVVVQQEQIGLLSERVAAVEERRRQSSRNSSQPPSSDPPSVLPRPPRKRSGRTRGGQLGHAGHGRALLPPEQVDQVVVAKPTACVGCGHLLLGADLQPGRHQVSELPRVVAVVTEYQRHTLTCAACGVATTADWPAGMPAGAFGPRVAATVGFLAGRCGVSHREAQEMLGTLCQLAVGLGSIAALERQVSAAVAAPVAAAHAYVQEQPVANVDETSWREQTSRCWLWVAVTSLVTVFLVRSSRGGQRAKDLLGAAFAGVVGSDRWSGYSWLDRRRRQVCWAHLIRDFEALVERGGASKALGTALLAVADRLFAHWYQVREGTLDRATFTLLAAPLQAEVAALLRTGLACPHPKTARLCANLLQLEPALWTFVTLPGVEPTNNAAERAVRRAVLWRRRSGGTQSAAGSRFVERVLTVVSTLRQQRRDVLDYLTDACAAALVDAPAPSLLPLSTPLAAPVSLSLPLAA
jgi:transposase